MKNLSGVLVGTLVGAGLGLLFAPDKGTNTRKKIKEEAMAMKDELKETTSDLSEKMNEAFTSVKNKTSETFTATKEDLNKDIEKVISKASYTAEDIIASLEAKLQHLKDANKKLQKNT